MLYEVKYQLGDKSMQVTIVNAGTDTEAFALVEEELRDFDMGYRILEVRRVS